MLRQQALTVCMEGIFKAAQKYCSQTTTHATMSLLKNMD